MKEPRAWVIHDEADSGIASNTTANVHDVAADRIREIRIIATCNPHNVKSVLKNTFS